MFKVNDYVVYKRDVCKVKEIKKNHINSIDYYVLTPIDDETLIIDVPTENRLGLIREVISKDQVEKIINNISNVELISITNDKLIEQEYKKLLSTNNHNNLIKIIKTTYLRNKDRLNNNKKIGEKDSNYFHIAEKLLYNEFSIALNLTYDEVKNYIEDKVKAQEI